MLNPLLYRLKIEADVLSSGNLTWRYRSRGLVSLVPVRSYLMDADQDNLDQFLSLHPECGGPIQEHDKGLQLLVESCRQLESALINSKEMEALFQRLTTHDALGGRDIAEIFGKVLPFNWLKALAEYIINNVERLPRYYSTAEFWNEHSGEFLMLRQSPEVRPAWESTVSATTRFSQQVDRLIELLKQVRNELSLSAGVPIVENLAR